MSLDPEGGGDDVYGVPNFGLVIGVTVVVLDSRHGGNISAGDGGDGGVVVNDFAHVLAAPDADIALLTPIAPLMKQPPLLSEA